MTTSTGQRVLSHDNIHRTTYFSHNKTGEVSCDMKTSIGQRLLSHDNIHRTTHFSHNKTGGGVSCDMTTSIGQRVLSYDNHRKTYFSHNKTGGKCPVTRAGNSLIRSFCSNQMSDVSKSIISPTNNEGMSESLIFLSESLIRSFVDKKPAIRSEIK